MTDFPVIVVDSQAPLPPYEQVRVQFSEIIRSGRLKMGDQLPSVRQLAADLGLAAGTTARAYQALEAEGLIRSRRGGGTRVAYDSQNVEAPARKALLLERTDAFVNSMRMLGFSDAEMRNAWRTVLAGKSDASSE